MVELTKAQQLVIDTILAEGSINTDDTHHKTVNKLLGLGWIEEFQGDYILTDEYHASMREQNQPTPEPVPVELIAEEVTNEEDSEELGDNELEDGQIVIELGTPITIQVGVKGDKAIMAKLPKGYLAPVITFNQGGGKKGNVIMYLCLHVETRTEFWLNCRPESTDPRAHTMKKITKKQVKQESE